MNFVVCLAIWKVRIVVRSVVYIRGWLGLSGLLLGPRWLGWLGSINIFSWGLRRWWFFIIAYVHSIFIYWTWYVKWSVRSTTIGALHCIFFIALGYFMIASILGTFVLWWKFLATWPHVWLLHCAMSRWFFLVSQDTLTF